VVTVGVAAGVAEASLAALTRAAVAAVVMPAAVAVAAVVAGCAFAATVAVPGTAHAVMSVIAASVSAAAIIAPVRRRRLGRLRRPPCLLPNVTESPPFASVPVDRASSLCVRSRRRRRRSPPPDNRNLHGIFLLFRAGFDQVNGKNEEGEADETKLD
jgi:hypothetical protein